MILDKTRCISALSKCLRFGLIPFVFASCALNSGSNAIESGVFDPANVDGIETADSSSGSVEDFIPAAIEILSGDVQSATAGVALGELLVAVVKNSSGTVLEGVTVAWSVASGDGELVNSTLTTDALGLISTEYVLGISGTNEVTVTIEGTELATTFLATALTPAALVSSDLDLDFGILKVGESNSLSFTLSNTGESLASAILPDLAGDGFLVSSSTCLNLGDGANLDPGATCEYTIMFSPEVSQSVNGAVGFLFFDGAQAQIVSGPALLGKTVDLIRVDSGDLQTTTINAQLSDFVIVEVLDSDGFAVPDILVNWEVSTGNGSLDDESSVTDAQGFATNAWTLGNALGSQSITASVDGTSLSVDFTATAIPGATLSFSPSSKNFGVVAVSSTQSQSVTISNVGDSTATTVYLAVSGSGFSLANNLCGINASPVSVESAASCTFDVVFNPSESDTVTGSVSLSYFNGFETQSATMTLSGRTFESIAVSANNNQSKTVGTELNNPFVAIVRDSSNDPVASATVNWAVTAGAGSLTSASSTTDSNGLASTTLTLGAGAGANTVSATINGTVLSTNFSATGLTAASLAFNPTSKNYGFVPVNSSNSQSFTLTNSGQSSATSVSIAISGTGYSLANNNCGSGGTPVSLVAGANCTFDAVFAPTTTATASGTVSLSFNDGAATQTTPSVALSGKVYASIAVSTGNNQSKTVGTQLSNPFVAIIKDGDNNVVQNATVNWAVTAGGGSLTTASSTTDSNGLASTTLTLGAGAGANTVSATINGTVLSTNFSATGLTPASLAFDPTSNAYGTVVVGESSSESFTLTNSGQSSATNVYISISDAGYSLANNNCGTALSPVIVAASDDCTFDVVLSPVASGAANGTLSLSYHDGAATQTTPSVSMTGTGCGGDNPEVCSATPVASATSVDPSSTIVLTFSDGMDASTFQSSSVYLQDIKTLLYIEGTWAFTNSNKTLTYTPIMPMDVSTQYRFTVTTSATKTGGTAIASNYTLTFTTGDVMIGGVGFSSTSATPTIYGLCTENATGISATLDGEAVTLTDSDCSTDQNQRWSHTFNFSATGAHTLVVSANSTTSSDTSSKTITITQCASLSAPSAQDFDLDDSGADDWAGSTSDPLQITVAGQLKHIADNKATYKTKSFKLMNDIDLSCLSIGSLSDSTNSYTGTFDGNRKKLINYTYESAATRPGLFGETATGAVIKDLGVIYAYTKGTTYSGGLVGMLSGTKLRNSYFTGIVENGGAGNYRGLLVGYANNNSLISHSYAVGALKAGANYSGGMGGSCDGVIISNSFIMGSIVGTNYVGGFCGLVGASKAIITQSYVLGSITGTTYTGGLIGYLNNSLSMIQNSYSHASTYASSSITGGFIADISGSYIKVINSFATGTPSSPGTSGKFIGNLAGSVKVYNSFFLDSSCATAAPTGCPDSSGAIGLTASDLQSQSTFTNAGWDFDATSLSEWVKESANHYPKATLNYCGRGLSTLTAAESFAGGTGADAGNPYLISTPTQLARMSSDLTKYYALSGSITLDCVDWIPIGNGASSFTGAFDGNGYSITGVQAEVGWTTDGNSRYAGFFGNLGANASVTDLTLFVRTIGNDYVGGLAGNTSQGTIDGVTVSARVFARNEYAGGLGGYVAAAVSNSSSTGFVYSGYFTVGGLMGGLMSPGSATDTSSSAIVIGDDGQVGGLAGYSARNIVRSFSTGRVYGQDRVGGLVGDASGISITDSYSTSNLNALAGEAGGLIGKQTGAGSTISRNFAIGTATGTTASKGFIGTYVSCGTCTDNFFLDTGCAVAPTTGCAEAGSGAKGYNATYMKQEATFTNWNFDTIWLIDEGNDYPDLR